jgi:hypothetical protein
MMTALVASPRAATHAPGRRAVVASVAMLAPLAAVSAVGAMTGAATLAAPANLVSGVAEHLGITATDHTTAPITDAGTADSGVLPATTTAAHPASTAGGTGGTSAADASKPAPHENGLGCDDTLFANGAPPFATAGGPVGCSVGNSGDHRQNGVNGNGGSSQTDDSDTSGSTSENNAATDAHNDGHGCDDTLFANGTPPFATPGGPAKCTVGNSGDHRQNGADHPANGTAGNGATTGSNSPADGHGNASGHNAGGTGDTGHGNSPGNPAPTGSGTNAGSSPGNSGKGNSGNKH